MLSSIERTLEEGDDGSQANILPALASGAAAIGGFAILLVCGLLSISLPWAKELFALCLGVEAIAALLLYQQGRRLFAGIVMATFLALLVLSLLPVYVEHWTPQDGQTHRHTLWGFDHDH
jgi:hypothetical protein